MNNEIIEVKVSSTEITTRTDLNAVIYELNKEIDLLSSKADKWDYLVAVASGILCGMLDILWVGDFSLEKAKAAANEKTDGFVTKTAKLLGFEGDDVKDAVKFLEKRFPIPSDGNTPDFGGGLQHHLRDFAHHPTIIGLVFSLLTQFTEMSYGTDVNGTFKVVPVPEKSKAFIGKDILDKLFKGTVVWFFHLISDIAGSSNTAGITGGTGIPGPLLSLAKELSALPIFKNLKIGDNSLSVFLSKIFNGTLFAKHDENGKIIKDTVIKFDLRGELGAIAELGKQAIPVIANDCIVRSFYFIRRFGIALKSLNCSSFKDFHLKDIDWDSVKPFGNPTINRMLTISSAVFCTVDISDAVISQKYWIAVNYVGIGRFVVAINNEIANFLKCNDVKRIKQMYEEIHRNTFTETDNNIYDKIGKGVNGMNMDKFGLTLEQTEILYNLEWYKTYNDIRNSSTYIDLRNEWLKEWKKYMESGFASFVGDKNAVLHWFSSKEELYRAIRKNNPKLPWFRLVLLEAMIFEPYFPISLEKDKEGKLVPSTKYKSLNILNFGFSTSDGDKYLESLFSSESYYKKEYIERLRKCYDDALYELNEVLKGIIKTISITAIITLVTVITAGMFAQAIAVALVGANFGGLHGAALVSACLAYLGGGAIAAGGFGMAGGMITIVGGGAILGLGIGAGVGGAVGAASILEKKDTILQSAKLIVSMKEIFLNDEHDIEYSKAVFEQYVKKIAAIEKELVDMKLEADLADLKDDDADKEKLKKLKQQIENADEAVQAMKRAMKTLYKNNASFDENNKNAS